MFSKNQVFCLTTENLTSFNYHRVEYFLLEFCTCFPLTNVHKRMFGIFSCFFYILSYLQKLKKTWCLHTHRDQIFINHSRSIQNKRVPKTILQTLSSRKRVKNVSQNIKLSGSWGSSKFPIFQANNMVVQK